MLIINKLKKNMSFYRDAIKNMLAFAMYIGAQQVLMFPILAKRLDSASYANVIVAVAVMDALCGILGGQVGITRQLRINDYGETEQEYDFRTLSCICTALICIILPAVLFALKLHPLLVLGFTVTAVLANFCFYIRYYFRVNGKFNSIIYQKVFYLAAMIVGLLLVKDQRLAFLPLLLATSAEVVLVICEMPKVRVNRSRTGLFNESARRFVGLAAAETLLNSVTLVDKLLIYPLLGPYSLAVYNSGASMGKLAALITQPLNELVLVRLSKDGDKNGSEIVKGILRFSIPMMIVLAIVLLPVILLASYILYRQYFSDILPIALLLALAAGVSTTTSVMKSFVIKFAASKDLTLCYLVNLIVVAVACSVGAQMAGIIGFAWAMVIARLELFCSFVVVLLRARKNIEIAN